MAVARKEQENKGVDKPAHDFDLINFLEDCPSYKEIKLTIDQFKELEKYNGEFNIELFCFKCSKEKTFKSYYDMERFLSISDWKKRNMHLHLNLPKSITPSSVASSRNKISYEYFPYDSNFVTIKFKCTQCEQEYFFALLLKEHSKEEFPIMKVGQYPSLGQLSTIEVEKYKNELKKYFYEFKSSLNCYSQGYGIAAFIYLRRILEHLIETKYESMENKNSENKFIDKLKKVEKKEDIIPDELKSVKNQIYSILSKGVHEYSEEECMELYDCVKLIVEMILDTELEKRNKQKKVKEATLKISNKLQKNQSKKDGE